MTVQEAYEAVLTAEAEHAEFVQLHPYIDPWKNPVGAWTREDAIENHYRETVRKAREDLTEVLMREHDGDVNAAVEALVKLQR